MDINFKLENYVKKLGKRLGIDFAPKRAHDTDAGADLRTPHDFWVPAHDSVLVDLGVSVELPPNICCVLGVSRIGGLRHGNQHRL